MNQKRNPKGAGRKALPEYLRKTKLHDFRLPKWIVEWLLSHKGKGSLLLEEAVVNYYNLGQKERVVMENAIRQILKNIEANHIFDSHFVINELIKKNTDVYLQFAAQYASGNKPTHTAHMQIGHVINSLSGKLLEKLEFFSWSENIHGNGSPCRCWRKL